MEHEWVLTSPPWIECTEYDGSFTTIFSWRCDKCNAGVLTATDSAVDAGGALDHKPTASRLLQVSVLENCNEEMCKKILSV